jgi:hypothetical protein
MLGRRVGAPDADVERAAGGMDVRVRDRADLQGLPLSATQYYTRTDVVYDAELDQVYLAGEATRRSKLISGFSQVAQRYT